MRARLGKEIPGGFAGDLGGSPSGEDDPARWARRVSETGSEPRQRALVCGPRASASRRGESECGRVGPAFACEQAAWRGPSRGGGRPRGGPGRELGRGSGRAHWASRDWAAGRESGVAGRRAGWLRRWLGLGRAGGGGEWAAARLGPTWAAEMGWWVWVLGSFPFLILFSLSSISNSNKV